jgi:cytochrome c peroxidase
MKKYLFIVGVIAVALMNFQFNTTDDEPSNKVALGEKLFFDPILSSKKTISCASCHKPELAFADTTQFSPGVDGILTDRNTPSAMNLAGRIHLFWDGRANSLENRLYNPLFQKQK